MSDEIHTEKGSEPVEQAAPAAAASAPVDLAAERVRKRTENLKKAHAAAKVAAEKRKLEKAARAARKAAAAAPAVTDDQDPLQAMLEQPIASHEELAQIFANLEQTASALSAGTRAGPIVEALAWSTPSGKPTPRCSMGCKMLWPWLQKTGGLAKLAEQSAEILALVGVVVLLAPAVPPAIALIRAPKPPVAAAPPPPAAPPAPAPAPVVEAAPDASFHQLLGVA